MPMRIYNIILYTNMAEDSVVKAECITFSYQISGGEGLSIMSTSIQL